MKEFTDLGYSPKLDSAGNIFVSKPASTGFEKRSVVCLQAHSDMVPNKSIDSKHDFTKDPIIPVVDKE
jgi:dipeptidase D